MIYTASAYTGPRAVSFTATDGYGESSVVTAGSSSAFRAVAVHIGLRGLQGVPGNDGAPGESTAAINFAYGDANRIIIPTLTSKIVLAVNVNITSPFDGVGASLSMGTLAIPDLLVASTQLDMSLATEFEINPNVKFTTATDIYLTITPGAGATQGAGWIVVEAATFN